MKILRPLAAAFVAAVFCIYASNIASAAPPGFSDPRTSGPYAVGFSFSVLIDTSRDNRPVPVHVWYPVDSIDVQGGFAKASYPLDPMNPLFSSSSVFWEVYGVEPAFDEPPSSADGPFPVVMFSPGWGAAAWYHIAVAARVASHGFVVAVPYHWGDSALFSSEPFDHIAMAMKNRPIDLLFMLDSLLMRNVTNGDPLEGTIDASLVAASGWSLGGYAAMVLAAGDDQICDKVDESIFGPAPPESCTSSPPDLRVKAVVPLDGSTQVLWFHELSRIQVPTLGIGQEWGHLESIAGPIFATWQARLHAASEGRPAYRVDIGGGANHDNFSNICEAVHVFGDMGIFNAATIEFLAGTYCSAEIPTSYVTELVGMYMAAFLNTNLLDEVGYQPYLTPGYALTEPFVEFFVTEKRNGKVIDEDWPDHFVYFPHQPGHGTARAAKDPAAAQITVPYTGLPH